jgi:hypothetical protein
VPVVVETVFYAKSRSFGGCLVWGWSVIAEEEDEEAELRKLQAEMAM